MVLFLLGVMSVFRVRRTKRETTKVELLVMLSVVKHTLICTQELDHLYSQVFLQSNGHEVR